MPTPYVQQLAKQTGKSVGEIEKLWDKAKKIASEDFGKPESQFGSKEYSYVTGIVKKMVGKKEDFIDPAKFLGSPMNAKEFIESVLKADEDVSSTAVAMNSDNAKIGTTIPPKDTETDVPYKAKKDFPKEDLNIDVPADEKSDEKKEEVQEESEYEYEHPELNEDFERALDEEGV